MVGSSAAVYFMTSISNWLLSPFISCLDCKLVVVVVAAAANAAALNQPNALAYNWNYNLCLLRIVKVATLTRFAMLPS